MINEISKNFFCKRCKTNSLDIPDGDSCEELLKNNKAYCYYWDERKIEDEIIAFSEYVYGEKDVFTKKRITIENNKIIFDGYDDTNTIPTKYILKKHINKNNKAFWSMNKNLNATSQPFDNTPGWEELFTSYVKKESINKQKIIEQMDTQKSTAEKIDEKLREINFYSADENKGKRKIDFTDSDRDEIRKYFERFVKIYPEDVAFVRAVVRAKGIDKKTNDTVVKLGSYFDNSDINLPFKNKSDGLGKILDGGINYFTIINNVGPDDSDFRIEPGDKIPNIKFDKEDKPKPNPVQTQPIKDEPFEQVMKTRQNKGLNTLITTNKTDNNLTKQQKAVVEKLRTQGYIFKKPVDNGNYNYKKIITKEFPDGLDTWKRKGS